MHNAPLFQSALAQLACDLDIAGLDFDEGGFVNLDVDKDDGISIYRDEQRTCLVLAGVVGPVDEGALFTLAPDLLALALVPMNTPAPCPGYDEEQGLLVVYQHYPVFDAPAPGEMGKVLSGFIAYLKTMRRLAASVQDRQVSLQKESPAPESGLKV